MKIEEIRESRGKRVDNGEWVYGWYFQMEHYDKRHKHHFIIPVGTDLSKGTPIDKIQVEVLPETIGQFTARNDKIGNKIYSNDIVRIRGKYIGKVKFETGCFVIEIDDGRSSLLWVISPLDIEVISNMTDTPELMGEGK
jgi:hypothetical protein